MPILRNTAALTSSGTSELDATTKANLARQWPEAVAGSGVSLPAISSRIYANGAGPYLGAWVEDFVNVLGFGDSLGHRVFAPLQDILVSRLGLAGIALGRIQYNAVSGTVVRAAPNTQRRTDLWGSGHAMQIQNGAVLEFGALEGGATVIPFKSNKVSIYLAMEPGGGTCSVEYSNDNRATWISLETGISTDNPSIAPLIKTYTFTGAGVIFRVTSTSGNVEMIGARMVHTAKKGVVLGLSATGGNPLTSAIAGNASIRTSVIADLAPHLDAAFVRLN